MSQMSGVGGDRATPEPKVSNTSRAVLLLAVFVVLFITLLHELDNSPTLAASAKTSSAAPATQAAPVVPTTAAVVRTPADVKILVANGVGVAGAASKVAARLQPIGYQLAKPGNTTAIQSTSSVEFTPGFQAEAQAVATSLGLPAAAVQPLPNPSPVTDMQASNVLVIVGNDLASAAGVTTTTVAGSTGTTSATGTSGAAGITGPLTANSSTTVTTTATATH